VDEREVDRLYGLPLEEFTAERNALAKRLRADGEREAADEVAALAKPTVPAWLANQLARTNEVQVRALLREGERLRDAQRTVLTGGGADVLRDAQQAEREVVAWLTAQARKLLPGVSAAMLERLSETLRAAATGDDETRDLLKRGRLAHEVELSGFTALAGMPVEPRTKAAGSKRDDAKEREQRKEQLAAARERLKAARAAARDAEQEAKQLEREAARARASADEAAADVARAEEEVAALRS
jgi:hypothetical protein